ncbi:C-X-C chemokine receptor type 3-2 isoform X1 [Brienomyrus brachyistius]|uniref:C-X-C chemokine receptor type 3-2 isoform X1 n=1 Tax=Brienomyrus brachyistius TaxID=42636 RepID=UPI0020B193F5|nr:C-X-C chemokine receptor type 3-2 isoform X1 [Brienomyrus brachyistius]
MAEQLSTMTTEYYEDGDYLNMTEDHTSSYATPCSYQVTFKFAETFIPVVFILVFVIAVVGNVLVLCVVRRYRRSREGPCSYSLTDTFLLHLAVSDFLLAMTLPFYAIQWAKGWVFGVMGCKMISAIFSVNLYSGILLLACISFDRYLAIVHVVTAGWHRRSCHAQMACAVVWTACFGLACVDVMYQTVIPLEHSNRQVCYLVFPEKTNWHVVLPMVNLILGFGLPLLVMLYCYIRIFRSLCHASRRQKRKSMRLIISLVSIFLLCWAPYNGFRLVEYLNRLNLFQLGCEMNKALDIGTIISESLGLTHCAFNPILYGFVGVKFRKELLIMWKGLLCSLGYQGLEGWGMNQQRRRRSGTLSTDSENTSYFSVIM